MKQKLPYYYKEFKCTSTKCTDNCCVGWEIDIDDKSCVYYNDKSIFGDGFVEKYINIDTNDVKSFKMHNNRCVFLNNDNLCSLIINYGENSLCDICEMHPRFINVINENEEFGLGFACEEAARLILNSIRNDEFIELECELNEDVDIAYSNIYNFRNTILNCDENLWMPTILELLDKSYGFEECMSDTIYTIDYRVDCLASLTNDFSGLLDIKNSILEDFLALEILDTRWEIFLNNNKNLEVDCSKFIETKYIMNIFNYFIYRYLILSYFDLQFVDRLKFAIVCTFVIIVLSRQICCENDRVFEEVLHRTCIMFSKDVEYNESNIDLILDSIYFENKYDYDNIVLLVNYLGYIAL